jgi:hypothetical protein
LGCGAHHADGPSRRWVREPLEGQPVVLTMDWVAEGFTLVLLGVLVAVVTMRGGSADPVTQAVYAVAAGALLVFAVWTAATAARGSVIFFKICPVVKSLAAALLIAAIAL